MKKDKAVSEELYCLLYDIKELAVEQTPVVLKSLINSFSQIGYKTFFESIRPNHFRLEVLKRHEDKNNCDFICAINLECYDGYEAIIDACIWCELTEFNYTVSNNKLIYLKQNRPNK